jgi:hypothetical protein
MIERVREMVDKALDWLVDKAVSAGEGILNRLGFGGQEASDENSDEVSDEPSTSGDWREGFTNSVGERHTLRVIERSGRSVLVINPDPLQEALTFINSDLIDQQEPSVINAKNLAEHIDWQLLQSPREESTNQEIDENIDRLALLLSRIRMASGLQPTGKTPGDAIPMLWYKDTNNDYPPTVTLQDGLGNQHTYSFGGGSRPLFLNEETVRGVRAGTLSTSLEGLYSTQFIDGELKYYVEIGLTNQNMVREGAVLNRTGSYRGIFNGRYQRALRLVFERHGFPIGGLDADHVKDLQFGGPDDFINLWPLNSSINRSSLRFADQPVSYLNDNGQLITTTLNDADLLNHFFIVDGFARF